MTTKTEIKQKIGEYIENKIVLKDHITPYRLKKIDFSGMIRLKTFKNELIKLVLDSQSEKEIKAEKVVEILIKFDADISDQSKKNALVGFKLFKKLLAMNGQAKSMIEYLNLEHQLSRKLITMTALKVNKSRPLPFAGTLIIEKILFREVWSVRDMSPTALK